MEPESVKHNDFEVEKAANLGNSVSAFPETPKKAYTRGEGSYGRGGRGFDPDGEQTSFLDDRSCSL